MTTGSATQRSAHVIVEPHARLDVASIGAELRARIASYKVPRRIEIVDALPRDDNGKIARRKIRDWYWKDRQSRM
jgi:long-chain acyl-CoA synthetase